MNIPYYLEQLINSVEDNSSQRFSCPKCGHKDTLSVTKENGYLKYNCYSDSCNLRYRSRYLTSVAGLQKLYRGSTKATKQLKVPTYLIYGLASEKCLQMLLKGNCLIPYRKGLFNVAYDPAQDRVCFLVKKNNKIVGIIGRAVKTRSKPKVLNYEGSCPDSPFIVGNSQTLVLVEDCLSAASVTRIPELSGLALLGTTLKNEHIILLKQYDKIIVALDKDAIKKAVDLRNRLLYYHPNVVLWRLPNDIKNLNDKELIDSYIRI